MWGILIVVPFVWGAGITTKYFVKNESARMSIEKQKTLI